MMPSNDFKMNVLIVDDDPAIRSILVMMIQASHSGISIEEVENGHQARQIVAKGTCDIVFLDIILPDFNGLEVLRHIKKNHPKTIVIMITGYPSLESAIECMKLGAMDYLVKPFTIDNLKNLVQKAQIKIMKRIGDSSIQEGKKGQKITEKIIGKSSAIRDIITKIERIAATDSTVLITGESGAGKDLIASAIHNLSPRADNDFVPVDCSALVESLLESELFGHTKGAFTGADETKIGLFELANKGTFFFDEIGNLSNNIQSKLLRVLQEREFRRVGSQHRQKLDIRVISSSNRDLLKAVERGTFRNDLYYRINVVPIHIPPLRERSEDIPLLLEYFLKIYNKLYNCHVQGFSEEALEMLEAYPWPGNVRELQHLLEQILVLENCDFIQADNLPPFISQRRKVFNIFSENLSLEDMEKRYIQFILRQTKGIRQQAADVLQINRKTLSTKIKKYGLRVKP